MDSTYDFFLLIIIEHETNFRNEFGASADPTSAHMMLELIISGLTSSIIRSRTERYIGYIRNHMSGE